jgi:signal transduction histidine kinase
MVGSVWASGEPAWIEDLAGDTTSERARAASGAGLRAAVAVPVALRGEVVAVLELFAFDVRPVDSSLLSVLRQTAAELARVAERERAIEERLRIEEKMRQAQKMEAIGRLAGGVAHDFNNLLTVITMEAHAVLDSCEETGLDPDMPKNILSASERAAHLTRQLLTFSRGRPTRPTSMSRSQLKVGDPRRLRA